MALPPCWHHPSWSSRKTVRNGGRVEVSLYESRALWGGNWRPQSKRGAGMGRGPRSARPWHRVGASPTQLSRRVSVQVPTGPTATSGRLREHTPGVSYRKQGTPDASLAPVQRSRASSPASVPLPSPGSTGLIEVLPRSGRLLPESAPN
ncbi:hypothetical protein Cadr_000018556 [Camelus dromedarius]|uniref:Uncharacterized protein n=1 Tax=Camelus dromedarius TaxID=9838 RepID=A0A5N4D4U2_CAMDR|nr:hypothetical protein Cadr_000018556 [Camelus dromedarius]